MRRIDPIDVATAEKLIDFRGRGDSAFSFARQQLEGAVALHNLLATERFAYIADEVGMGKTYVALGTIGLLRHFNPGFRAACITPTFGARSMADGRRICLHRRTDLERAAPERPFQLRILCCKGIFDSGCKHHSRHSIGRDNTAICPSGPVPRHAAA